MATNADLGFQIVVGGVQQTVLSIKELEKVVKDLGVTWKAATIGTEQQTVALKEYMVAQAQLKSAVAPSVQGLTNLSGVSANAGQALLNLNYVIRDSPYFFNNFAMGVLAVGNNINPLIDRFSALRREAALMTAETGKSVTTMSLLKSAMVGGAGISIAFSVVITAIQAFVFQMSKANKETKELAESTGELAIKMTDIEKAVNRIRDSYREKNIQSIASDEVYSLKRLAELWKEYRVQQGIALGITTSEGVAPNAFQRGFANQEMTRIMGEITLIVDGWVNGGEKVNETNKKIKKDYKDIRDIIEDIVKTQTEQVRLALDPGQRLSRQVIADPFSEYNLREKFGMKGKYNVKNPMEETQKIIKQELDDMNKFNLALETGKIFAQQLGETLNQAFMHGKLALDEFIKSLISAIAQMLILRAVTAFLTGGASSASPSVSPTSAITPKIGMNKNVIQVTGKITADKNNFVANIRNADNYFKKNEEFVVIGR